MTNPAPHPEALYGPELPLVASLGVGPTMAVAVQGERAYFIGRGRLRVADISRPAQPRVLGEIAGLGNTRQIVVDGTTAYVSSREDGVFVVDASDPAAPRLLCHYDAIEFATGLALGGRVLFIACRQFGIEAVDVSDPHRPRHLSVTRTGEAQSAAYHDGYLYVGVWGTSEMVVVDVHDASRPAITARVPLDGFGDGVAIHGGIAYAATGHHSRNPRAKEGDPGYGHGHGLELFSLKDPAHPHCLSRVKFPPFYHIGNDMWGVQVVNGHAFVSDTHNGIFVVDVRDPEHPRCVAHRSLPNVPERKLPGFVGGLALARDHINAAGGWTDLPVIAAPGLAAPVGPDRGAPPAVGSRPPAPSNRYRAHPLDGQVWRVGFHGDVALIAAGSTGLQTARLWPEFVPLHRHSTEGFAVDLVVRGDLVYVAEGYGGLSIWRAGNDGALAMVGRYRVPSQSVRQVVVPEPGRYALLAIGSTHVEIVDVSNPAAPRSVLREQHFGLLYGDQIAEGVVDGRYACVFWHESGIHWYDLGAEPPVLAGNHAQRMNMVDGVAMRGNQALVIARGGYFLLDRKERRPFADLPCYRIPGLALSGKPVVAGDTLTITHRADGRVLVVDISDITAPRLREEFRVADNPSRVALHGGRVVIPGGYEGVLVIEPAAGQ